MTVEETLKQAQIDRLDAEVLLGFVLHQDRAWLIANYNEEVPPVDHTEFSALANRRLQHEPVAHLTGSKEFYGREFIVNKNVLIPRPSTEGLVTAALDMLKTGNTAPLELDTEVIAYRKIFRDLEEVRTIVDIGTGSGCIAISLALELPEYSVIAIDISADALEVAKQNVAKHNVADRVQFRVGDLLEPINDLQKPFLLVSNPPYISNSGDLEPEVIQFEPSLALYGGEEGSELVLKILDEAPKNPLCYGVCLECRRGQIL